MAIYRASEKHGVAWITGGSTGIGRALALQLAADGYTVAVTAREPEQLAAVAADATGEAGRVLTYAGDVTDPEAMAAVVAAIETDAGPIVLAVFNAGTFTPTTADNLDIAEFRRTFDVNVFGVINGVAPVVEAMRVRGRGHIVIVGSVTSYFGLPTAAAYGSTKAALNNLAQSLRFDLDKMNVRIQIINPGFVATPLIAKNQFPMPALIQPEEAAIRIARALRSGGFEVTFPRRLTWTLKVLRLLPSSMAHAIIGAATRWKMRPLMPRPPQD